jgi:hypothetical protein
MFNATVNSNLDYNLASEQGVLVANSNNGAFLNSNFTSLLKTLAKNDITKETYNNVALKSEINKKVIQSVVSMQSENTAIDVPNSALDFEKQTVDANVNLKIKKYDVKAQVSGFIPNPIIKIDASKILENKVKEKIEKKINQKIQSKLQAKATTQDDDDMSKLINKLKATY